MSSMKAYSYVRWSKAIQEAGDSPRRQTNKAAEWANLNDVELDNSTYQDHGISAFRGKNVVKGRFGAFLKAVDDGVIPTPCYLLVEAFDRISRQDIFEAQKLFLDILDRNITIVVLKGDGQVFSREKLKTADGLILMMSALMSLVTAHEESAKKSERLKQAFAQHRKQQQTGVITTRNCPSWLKVVESDGELKFIKRPDRVKVVQKIFELSLAGNGKNKIAQRLNEANHDAIRKGKAPPYPLIGPRAKGDWIDNHVDGILRQGAPAGKFISHTGLVIDNYYPAVISEKDWIATRSAIRQRRNGGGWGQGTQNLFSMITRCAYCGRTLRYIKNSDKRYAWLWCRTAMNHACKSKMFHYTMFETGVLTQLAFLSKADMSSNKMEATAATKRRDLQGEIEHLDDEVKRLAEAIAASRTKSHVLIERLDTSQERLDKAQAELATLVSTPSMQNDFEEIMGMLLNINRGHYDFGPEDPEKQKQVRLKVQTMLRRQLERVDVAAQLDLHPDKWVEWDLSPKRAKECAEYNEVKNRRKEMHVTKARILFKHGLPPITFEITDEYKTPFWTNPLQLLNFGLFAPRFQEAKPQKRKGAG